MLKTIDLFAGAGGLSYGFESTGEFLIVAAAENNKNAKTIVVNLKRFAENDERKYLQLLEKPFASAELLLGNNSAEALDFLCQVE